MSTPETSPLGDPLPGAVVDQIKAERAAKNIPLGVLAGEVDISPRTLTRYFNGEREMKLGLISKFAAALGLSLPELIRLAEERVERN